MITRMRAAAFAVTAAAALGAPLLLSATAQVSTSATGRCLAWFGSRDDGQCIGYSSGSPTNIGTPNLGVFGPNYGGLGVTSGPLLPGQTITQGLSP